MEGEQRRLTIDLYICEDSLNKPTGSKVTQRSAKQAQMNGDQTHVSKIKCCLQETIHLSLEKKVVNSVEEDISSCTGSTSKSCPLPQVILRIQAEIHHNDRRHTYNNGQNGVDTQQKAIDMVEFVVPEGRQDIVQFNKDGSETEKASQWNKASWSSVPWNFLGNGSWNGIDTAWELILDTPLSSQASMTSK